MAITVTRGFQARERLAAAGEGGVVLTGCIADDFTGATDLAGMLVKAGLRTVQMIGLPDGPLPADTDAVVIALKSRTAPVDEAVADSLTALEYLRGAGARQIYFKYCSTFDSTPAGNIGPVADALLDALGADFTVICPAFPANGRRCVRRSWIRRFNSPTTTPLRPWVPTTRSRSLCRSRSSARSSGACPSGSLSSQRAGSPLAGAP